MNFFSRIFNPDPAAFTVKFGRTARTLEYSDRNGRLVFTFDADSDDGKSLVLEHYSPRSQRHTPRYTLAFDRTQQHLESIGYAVKVNGAVDISKPVTADEVANRIQAELNGRNTPIRSHLDLNKCLIPPRLLWFRGARDAKPSWELWLVFEEHPVTHDGWRIVFDEFSSSFGVADGDLFGGFEGTFIQTLEAISKR